MTRFIIYKSRKGTYRLIDTKWERLIGVYYTPIQARHGLAVYEGQGSVGAGMEINKEDEWTIDELRRLHEAKIEALVRARRQNSSRCESERDREIGEAIDRLSGK